MRPSHYISLLKVFIIFFTFYITPSYSISNQGLPQEILDGDTMVVISAAKYQDALEPFIEWKNRRGIFTSLYVYPDETGGTGDTLLKEFIQGMYDSTHVTYVLLIGDYEDIPALQGSAGGASDPSFTYLDGDDRFHDACIGRFSVETVEQTEIMVEKIIRYEMTPDTTGEWYQKATGIASNEGSPADKDWMDSFRDTLLAYGYAHVDQIYDPDAKKEDVLFALNEGRSWVTYMGHGSKSSFATSKFNIADVDSLENTDMLPVIVSLGADNGDFKSGTCLAEAFLRAGSKGESKGAIAFYGFSFSTPSSYWACVEIPKFIIKNLTKRKLLCLGNILVNSLNSWLVNNPNPHDAQILNLFGDPSQIIITQKPEQLEVSHPDVVNMGMDTVTIHSEDSIKLCIYSKANSIHIIQNISPGDTRIAFEVSTLDTIHVTGIKMNHAPYIGYMTVDTSTGIIPVEDYASQAGVCVRFNKVNQHYMLNVYLPMPSVLSCDYTVYNLSGTTISEGKLTKSSDASYSGIINLGERTDIPAGIYLFAVKVKCAGKSPLYIYKRISILY